MKKLFVCALAVGMFTACSQEETLSTQAPMQISFDGAFVSNATRAAEDPSITTATIDGFDVWAFMDETSGVVFDGEDVTGSKEAGWTYKNTQYWAPSHTYYFAALAPMNSVNVGYSSTNGGAGNLGLGNISFKNIDGTEDLIYAATTKTTPAEITSDPGKVSFEFKHLLSKVKFSFTNSFQNDNAFITVKNIKMTAPSEAQINLNQADWWSSNEDGKGWALTQTEADVTLAFGDMEKAKVGEADKSESQYERLTFPAKSSRTYVVTFDVELYMGEVLAYTNTLETTISGAGLKMGYAYNFHAEINADNIVPGDGEGDKLFPIEFDVIEVKDWDKDEETNDSYIYDGEEINTESLPFLGINSIAAGETKELEESAVIATTLNVAGTLDGKGNTLSAAAEPTDNGMIRPTGGAEIKNVTLDGGNKHATEERNLRAIFITSGGEYTFDNVKAIGFGYALNVSTTAAVTLTVNNSTLEGWTSYGTSTTATFDNVTFTCGTYELLGADAPYHNGYFRPYGQTTLNNCKFAEGFKIDLSSVGEGKTIKFTNCYYNNVLITAENINTLDFIENYAAGKVAF